MHAKQALLFGWHVTRCIKCVPMLCVSCAEASRYGQYGVSRSKLYGWAPNCMPMSRATKERLSVSLASCVGKIQCAPLPNHVPHIRGLDDLAKYPCLERGQLGYFVRHGGDLNPRPLFSQGLSKPQESPCFYPAQNWLRHPALQKEGATRPQIVLSAAGGATVVWCNGRRHGTCGRSPRFSLEFKSVKQIRKW